MEDYPYPKPKKQVSKRRMVLEKKTVVKVKIGANPDQKLKRQILPSDSCSWRKYGEKLIKGTPYPRGYYRCTTSKGCLAKKQVERSKEDASMIIITYTCGHNHPGPDIQAQPTSSAQAQPPPPPPLLPVTKTGDGEKRAQKKEDKPYMVKLENKCFEDDVEEENEVSWSELMRSLSSAPPTSGGESKLFDELGELPHTSASSSFTSFMKNYFFDERMLVSHP